MVRFVVTLLVVLVFLSLSGCAGTNTVEMQPRDNGNLAGFWSGLWHGLISPISFIGSLLDPDIEMYDVHNNGGWYNLGFALGAGILLGAARRREED